MYMYTLLMKNFAHLYICINLIHIYVYSYIYLFIIVCKTSVIYKVLSRPCMYSLHTTLESILFECHFFGFRSCPL